MPTADREKLVGTFQWRIAAQQDELEMIALERKALEIRATQSGVVTAVLANAGQAVDAGQALITLFQPASTEIVAYVPAAIGSGLTPGTAVSFERSSQPLKIFSTTVSRIGPHVVEVPEQVRAIPSVSEWALPVYLVQIEDAPAVPGESIRVRFAQ